MLALSHLPVTCHQSGHVPPPLLNPEEDGPSLQLLFVTPPPAESLGNQVGRLTFIFLSSGGLEAHTTLRNGCRCHRHCDFFGVWSGSMALAESRPVDVCLETIYACTQAFSCPPSCICLISTVAWFGTLSRVCLHAYLPRLFCFSALQDMCICMLLSSAHHRSVDCFSLIEYEGALSRRVHVHTAWSSLDQYPNTDSTV